MDSSKKNVLPIKCGDFARDLWMRWVGRWEK